MRRHLLNQRHFFAVDLFDEFEIISLKSLISTHVQARHQNLINCFVELVARLLPLVIFEVQLAFTKMIAGPLDHLIDAPISLLNFIWDLAGGRAAGNLGLNDCGKEKGCGKRCR